MTVATQSINRAPRPSSLADVLEVVLDKGIVIDAYVRVAVWASSSSLSTRGS